MATLTETAYYTKKMINFGIIGLFVLIILKILLDFSLNTWRKLNPPPPPPPTVFFGKLPAIKFPNFQNYESTPSGLTFKLETVEGGPPPTSPIGTVFFIQKPAPNLLSLTKARQFAAQLGFVNEPQAQTQTIYLWENQNNPLQKLQLDIVTNNFKITYDYSNDLSIFTEKNLPNSQQAIVEAKNFLQNLGLLNSSLVNGQIKTSFWQLVGNNLIQTTSLANADAIRVDFGRESIEGLPLFNVYSPKEFIYFIFSGNNQQEKRLLEVSYHYWEIDKEQKATYPLKTSAQAFEELKQGQSFIVRKQESQEIIIRKIYLGYFYPEDYQPFLQPIFVFEGDPDFLAFVPAVSSEWVGR